MKTDRFSIDDFRAQLQVRRLEEERELRAMPKLIEENQMLREKNQLLENGTEVFNWYISVLEEGLDTREITGKYFKLKNKH